MVTIKFSAKNLAEVVAGGYVFFVEQEKITSELEEFAQHYFPQLSSLMKERSFTGKKGSSLVIPVVLEQQRIVNLVILGLGQKNTQEQYEVEVFRRLVGKMVRIAEDIKLNTIACCLPPASWFGISQHELAKEFSSISRIASYHFDLYFTNPDDKVSRDLTITLVGSEHEFNTYQEGVLTGRTIAEAVNAVRTWVDLPPAHSRPEDLAEDAYQVAKEYGLSITVFDEKKINEIGMGGLAAVSVGSDLDCRFIILQYTVPNKQAPTIGIVGKGITFDSGGLSLKPAAYMETMKDDMSGASIVIATMQAIAQLKPNVNVVAFAPVAENLPSGKAVKPGDIIRFYNGKTAEVRNTDAEGRLILADALSYAVKHYKLDALIDLATLTGACAYALGPFYTGLFSKHDDLVRKLEKASKATGERVWRLPMDDDFKVAIRSTVADICNIGNERYKAGAITAAFFLENFVGEVPWVHLDIAGTAFDVPDISYYRPGATGVGVRLLVDLIMNW